MIHSEERWKTLNSSSRVKTESHDNHRSRSKKYNPHKALNQTNFSKNMRVIANSRIDGSSMYENRVNGVSRSSVSRVQNSLERSQTSHKLKFDLKLKTVKMKENNDFSEIEEPLSPDIDLKLSKIQKQMAKQRKEKQVHYSLDEEHRYLHREIEKVKQEFLNFKKFIMLEINRQQKIIKDITHQMLSKIQENSMKQSDIVIRQSLYDRNIIKTQRSASPILIDDFSSINRDISSPSQSKIQINKFVKGLDSSIEKDDTQVIKQNHYQKCNSKKINRSEMARSQMLKHLPKSNQKVSEFQQCESVKFDKNKVLIQGFRQRLLKDEGFDKKSSVSSTLVAEMRQKAATSREKSRHQFTKLFQAVKTLKNDIRGLSNVKEDIYHSRAQTERNGIISPRKSYQQTHNDDDDKKSDDAVNPLKKKFFSKNTTSPNGKGSPVSALNMNRAH